MSSVLSAGMDHFKPEPGIFRPSCFCRTLTCTCAFTLKLFRYETNVVSPVYRPQSTLYVQCVPEMGQPCRAEPGSNRE